MAKVATLEVEIGAKIDKFERSLGKVRKDLKGMETRLGGVSRGASKATGAFSGMAKKLIAVGLAYFGARGIFRMAKSFLDVSTSIETYKLRLEAMLGSQEAATEAMNYFKEVAAKVPFTLEAVIEAGVKVQAFGADLKAWTPIMADLAAYMGVTLPEAAGALGRAFAGGVGAADIFRERGILQVIRDFAKMEKGIDDITKISIPEFRDVMFEAFAGAESKVAGTADKLATTWLGVISMLQDKWFQFRDTVMKTKVFELMKEGLVAFNESLDEFVETGGLEEWAKDTAIAVIGLFKIIAQGIETLMLVFHEFQRTVFEGGELITRALRIQLELWMKTLGVFAKIAPVGSNIRKMYDEMANALLTLQYIGEGYNETNDKQIEKMTDIIIGFEKLFGILNKAKEAIRDTKEEMVGLGKETAKFSVITTDSALPAARNFTDILKQAKPTLDSYTFAVKGVSEAQMRFSEMAMNEFMAMELNLKGFVNAILNIFEKWALGQIVPKIMAALPFPLNLLAVGGAIGAVRAIFAGIKGMKEGGVVMQEGIYHLHAREMVLPIEKAPQIMREMGQSVPGSGGGINITYAPQINAMDSQDVYRFMAGPGRDAFEKMIRSNVRGIARQIKEETEKF